MVSADQPHRLDGLVICMLVTNDVSRDARVQKEAESAAAAGARVVVIGVGQKSALWQPDTYELRLVRPMVPSTLSFRFARIVQNLLRVHALEMRVARAARRVSADIIHCNDLDTIWAGSWAARGRAAVVYDAHELSTEGGVVRPWERFILGTRARNLVPKAAAVVAVNQPIAEWLRANRGLQSLPTVVMNGAKSCSAGSTSTSGPIRMLFQGQFFFDRNIEAAVRCMPELRGRATLTLQGWGEAEESLRELVNSLGVADVVEFVDPCSPAMVVEDARQYDVGLILHRPINLNHIFSSPNKLFDYIGAGLAVVAPALPVFQEIVAGCGCGRLFSHYGAPSLSETLEALANSRGLVEGLKAKSREACEIYAWPAQAKKLIAVYREVADRKGVV